MKINRSEILSATLDYLNDWFKPINDSEIRDYINAVIDLRLEFLNWLGLQTDEWMRVIIDPIPDLDREAARKLQTIAKVVLKRDVSLEEAILNRLSDGSRLSKKILRALDKYGERIRSAAIAQIKQVNMCLRINDIKDKVAAYVAANRQPSDDIITILSANPLDILHASYWCDYNSCFRPTGEYRFAPFIILGYPTTMIAYGADKEEFQQGKIHKRWRTWVMVPSADEIQIGRYYGNPTRAELRGIRRLLEMLLDSKFAGKQRYWRYKGESCNSALTYQFSLDFVYYDKVKVWSAEDKKHATFKDYIVVDVEDYLEIQRCDCCGENARELTRVYNDDRVCDTCLDYEFRYCHNCEEYYPESRTIYLEDIQEHYCDNCAEEFAFYCAECEVWYTEDSYAGTTDRDEYICQRCANDYYYTCENCGHLVHHTDAIAVTLADCHVCPDCEYRIATCAHCGKTDFKTDMHKHNGEYYCDSCECDIEEVENEEEADIIFG